MSVNSVSSAFGRNFDLRRTVTTEMQEVAETREAMRVWRDREDLPRVLSIKQRKAVTEGRGVKIDMVV